MMQFTTLLNQSTKLLYQIDIDWRALAFESFTPSTTEKTQVKPELVVDSEEESEDDDDLFGMLGGYESSDNEEKESEGEGEELVDDNAEEDDAALLKRAAAVHNALLLSVGDSKDLYRTTSLIDTILQRIASGTTKIEEEDIQPMILTYILSPSTIDNRPKRIRCSQQLWNKICSTNALVAVQYLLLLEKSNDVLTGWNNVILPLLLGNADDANVSLLMKHDVLREQVLTLTPSAAQSMKPKESITEIISNTCNLCIRSINDSASNPSLVSRQKKIDVVCSVLIHLLDNVPRIAGSDEVIKNSLHQAVVIILRSICYETVDGDKVHPPLLTVDALRVITGMLLLKLYPPSSNHTKASKEEDERVVQLWNEILLLMSPYSADFVQIGNDTSTRNMRRCTNWSYAAPLSATAILCVVLPTFISIELPVSATNRDNLRCRPALQSCVWELLRSCLGRCDEPNFTGCSREYSDSGGRGTSLLARENKPTSSDDSGSSNIMPTDQILRRRSAHCLRILVEYDRQMLKRNNLGSKHKGNIDAWMKYVLVFEMLEMEIELHLVEQVWSTVKELSSRVIAQCATKQGETLPQLIWEDIASILKRVLLSEAPTLRKLGLYRLLSGDAGIDVSAYTASVGEDDMAGNSESHVFMNKPKTRWKIKKVTGDQAIQSLPLSLVSVPFVLDVIIVSYDSIIGTKVGTNMQIEVDGNLRTESIIPMLSDFLSNYTIALARDGMKNSHRLSSYVNAVFGPSLIKGAKPRSLITIFSSLAHALESSASLCLQSPGLEQNTIRLTVRALLAEFSSGGAPQSLQDALKHNLAIALQYTTPWINPDVRLILQVLALYPPEESSGSNISVSQKSRRALTSWLQRLGNGSWAENAALACCSAFVAGDLMPFVEFEWLTGVNTAERELGMALCTLSSLKGNASEVLWPAISKGLQTTPHSDSSSPSFSRANRAMILLEFGCRENVLSGMGNGDILADKSQSLLPPPPAVEGILYNAASFVEAQLALISSALISVNQCSEGSSGANRSSGANSASTLLCQLIGQLSVLHLGFPSSVSMQLVMNHTMQKALKSTTATGTNVIESQILLYAALSCGAKSPEDTSSQIIQTCHTILCLDFLTVVHGLNARKDTKQALRSIFQYTKWGCVSLLLPMLIETEKDTRVRTLCEQVLQMAINSVDATPVLALVSLFKSVVTASSEGCNGSLQTTIDTLFSILNEVDTSSNWVYMLHEICKLIFRPKLLRVEYRSYCKKSKDFMPVRGAFEKLLLMGNTTKPHICKTAVSIISSAWLGEHESNDVGILAIPYRRNIVDLLIYKEGKVDDSSLHRASYQDSVDGMLPKNTNEFSVTRAFVLVFLSKLPPIESISSVVLDELIYFIVDELLDIGCKGPAIGKPFITGSEEYAKAIRSWQALCLLNQYITHEKAQDIVAKVFKSMVHNTHGPVRYFIEVFAIQCTRQHPDIFGAYYIHEINRSDISLQYVASLMVLGGNITAGKYSSSFFQHSSKQRIKDVLCGVIPWLSSTQGFSRAIAQLLVHKLIPLVVDINANCKDKCKDDSVLLSVHNFLENNGEMERLRVKQQNFFESYDVESACSLEGLLTIQVDEGEEASPVHLVDAIKDCLSEVYSELHEEHAPLWKLMEDLSTNDIMTVNAGNNDVELQEEAELVNFQRKILPIDALDLNIRSMKDQRLFNAAGKRKQNLIICATLVDKVPNLAGLTRTAEIFAAQTLIIPNLTVKKQDDFKTISASANDWIEMEECKEEDLLDWLYQKKSQGYTVVGLEQTSSSKCITKFNFPNKTCLLLGKEKEGIPVEFLSVVDQCIEIPQLGITRSLNVHVTGALAIWKYTEQMLRNTSKGKN